MKKRPLSGLGIVVGRARHQSDALSSSLRKLGARVLPIPFIEIRRPRSYKPLDAALRNIADYDWLILTSVNGVDALWSRIQKLKLTRKSFQHLEIAAIGPATRNAIERHGLKVIVVPKEYIAESVVKSLKKKVKGKRVLLARAKVARDVIPRELRKIAARVDVVEAYETVVPESSRARLRAALSHSDRFPDIITFTSSLAVRNFVKLTGTSALKKALDPLSFRATINGEESAFDASQQESNDRRLRFASIGPITSATLRELGLPVHIEARKYNIPGLIDAIVRASR